MEVVYSLGRHFNFVSFVFIQKLGGNIMEIAKVHSESPLCDNVLEIAKKDEKVIQILGELQPLGKLAIFEGVHKYSNDYSTLNITVNVIGSKEREK
ncbi:hypothetical protein [Maribacter sp. 2304DJ31-5]|uniref:hypothetical protein n=1 Tax=Maribacter sp. 2304DJ31-5 TaxID=3386273 RepID=UPI0039BD737E